MLGSGWNTKMCEIQDIVSAPENFPSGRRGNNDETSLKEPFQTTEIVLFQQETGKLIT